MQESKEIGPHITSKEELDMLYKNKKKSDSEEGISILPDKDKKEHHESSKNSRKI
ncbi:MAG: hypothetical protein WCI00_04580 [bacterium]